MHEKIRNTLLSLAWLVSAGVVQAADTGPGLVIQVSENNPTLWNQALNVAEQVPVKYGAPIPVEIVAFGYGMHMLRFESAVGPRLQEAAAKGIAIKACGTTMQKQKMTESDLYPSAKIEVVPAGAVEIIKKQRAGWNYLLP